MSSSNYNVKQPEITKHDSSVLDLAFAMDCTGSMGSYIETARSNIREIVESIVASEKSDVQLALVEYRDHPPQDSTFVTRSHDFTASVGNMRQWLNECSASGGGDCPEAVADALHDLLKLSWRENSTKIAILVSDAPPHGLSPQGDSFPNGCPANLDPMTTVRQLAEKGVTLYVVGCEPSINPYKDFFMALAYLTGGQYAPLRGAKALTQIIIGGAQEEISLERWMHEVDEEVQRNMEAGNAMDDLAMAAALEQKLRAKGAVGKKLMRNNADMESYSESSKKLSAFTNMREVQQNFKMASEPASSRFGGMGGARGMGAAMCMAAPGGPALGDTGDVYGAVDSSITTDQAYRMVQRSKAKMPFFKK